MSTASTSIPVIDLSLADDRDALVQTLRQACMEKGFFYVVGHGLTSDYLRNVLQESQQLFHLPLPTKQGLSDPTMSRGYTAMREETLDPQHQRVGDTKEGFYIGRHVPTTDPRYNPAKFTGPNQWPTETDMPEFRATMEDYFAQLSAVALQLTRLLASSLDLPAPHFDAAFVEPLAVLRLLHYEATESRPEDGVLACGAHSDYGMLTLLLTDETPGLQIFTKQNEWLDVPPRPVLVKGATVDEIPLVVNLGDMLERWTNGVYRSTVHRVVTSGTAERYSIPFFYEPAYDTLVECLPTCTSSPDNPPKYPPITSGDHLKAKYQETHADYAGGSATEEETKKD
jgi:isopenicillin N synthase-like dioxygenase